ncbi:MAG: 50S ribosomal protein L21 [bacterium]|nr:50S ribosomal protein L21 [bacterium]
MKAVITTGGKQYYVSEGESIYVEKLDGEAGSEVVFDKVLMIDTKVGNPYLNDATVVGKILKHGKQKKIKIFTYKQKDRSNRHRQGHRQPYTQVLIEKING